METKCFVCGNEDPKVVYIQCVNEGQQAVACVRCLPVLIHGAH